LEALEDLLKDQGKLRSRSWFRDALTTAPSTRRPWGDEALGG